LNYFLFFDKKHLFNFLSTYRVSRGIFFFLDRVQTAVSDWTELSLSSVDILPKK